MSVISINKRLEYARGFLALNLVDDARAELRNLNESDRINEDVQWLLYVTREIETDSPARGWSQTLGKNSMDLYA